MIRSILILICAAFPSAYGAYVGNPASPKIPEEGIYVSKEAYLAIKAGYIGSYAFDRLMKEEGKTGSFRILTNSGSASFAYEERFEAAVNLGSFRSQVRQFPLSGLKIEYQTDSTFAWSGEGTVVVFDRGGTVISVGASYAQASPDLNILTANGAALDPGSAYLRYREWQANIGAAQMIGCFIPYLGVKYSGARAHLLDARSLAPLVGREDLKLKNKVPAGIFLGFSLTPHKTVVFTAEARLIDEYALAISGWIKF